MHKVAHYRRALWLADSYPTLEDVLVEALSNCPLPADTKFEYTHDIDVHIAARSTDNKSIYFTLYSEGRRTATVEAGGENVKRRSAPDGEEFLRTGLYLSVIGNNLSYVADGHTNDGQITNLLHRFFIHAGCEDNKTHFGLFAKADRAQIKSILSSGVKSIDLGLSSFLTTINEVNDDAGQTTLSGILGNLFDTVKKIGAAPANATEIEAMADIEARVHLGYDGRSANQLLPHILSKLADGVVESSDEFKIITQDENVITRDKLVIKRNVNIEGDDIALNPQSAFTVLSGLMQEWKAAHVFSY